MRTSAVRKSDIVTECPGQPLKPKAAAKKSAACKPVMVPELLTQNQPRIPADCGHLPFVIKRDGTWLYRGSPITRKPMVCLFATVLKREEDGGFFLETPAEHGRIDVEDAPFVAVELEWSGHGVGQSLCFRTNTDQCVNAGPEHPIRISHDLLTCEPTPYLHVRDGKGIFPIEARINRATYYELVALAEPGMLAGRKVLGVWSDGAFFSLGDLPSNYEDK
jgi:uncharacterized protein